MKLYQYVEAFFSTQFQLFILLTFCLFVYFIEIDSSIYLKNGQQNIKVLT